jgi:CheY-like chemotaxis protein
MTTQFNEKSKTILLVDDQDLILDVEKAMLECLGYRVITANSGEMAVEIVSKYKDDIDLIILDLAMPGMNGTKVYDIIHGNYPKIPILISSGHVSEERRSELLQKGCYGYIQKPVSIKELSRRINFIFSLTEDLGRDEGKPS